MEISPYLPHNAALKFDDLSPLHLSAWQRNKLMFGKEKGVVATIKCDSEARNEAEKIFKNVATVILQFIGLEDLKPSFPNDDALKTIDIFQMNNEDENIKISLSFLQEWMVQIHIFQISYKY
ncbi:mechanosensitive ion channel protein 6-like [Raphanus sativus]|nr:mechanosensitive ion channel protein 6-like [Raphanus sativus]